MFGDIPVGGVDLEAEGGSQPANELLIPIALPTSEPMVEVCHDETPAVRRCGAVEEVHQNNGVDPPRHGEQYARAGRDQRVFANHAIHPMAE